MPNVEKIENKPKTTFTNWAAFVKAGLVPKEIVCNAYKPTHMVDMSCHSRLLLNAPSMIKHVEAEHGGGFLVTLQKSETEWPGWKEFSQSGMELQELRCNHCGHELPVSPQQIIRHMKSHGGENRRLKENDTFRMTISTERPLTADDEA